MSNLGRALSSSSPSWIWHFNVREIVISFFFLLLSPYHRNKLHSYNIRKGRGTIILLCFDVSSRTVIKFKSRDNKYGTLNISSGHVEFSGVISRVLSITEHRLQWITVTLKLLRCWIETGTIWRPVGLSLVYLGLALYSPHVPIPNAKTMAGHTGVYLKTCIGLSFLVAINQFAFHLVLLALPTYGHFLLKCT